MKATTIFYLLAAAWLGIAIPLLRTVDQHGLDTIDFVERGNTSLLFPRPTALTGTADTRGFAPIKVVKRSDISQGLPHPASPDVVPTNSEQCGIPRLTLETYKSGEGEALKKWLEQQDKEWRTWGDKQTVTAGRKPYTFYKYLVDSWTRNLDPTISYCDDVFCSPVSCEYIKDEYNKENQKYALYALQMITVWHQEMLALMTDVKEAIGDQRDRTNVYIRDFTDSQKFVASMEAHKLRSQRTAHILSLTLLVLQPFVALAESPIASAVSGSLVGAYVGGVTLAFDTLKYSRDPYHSYEGQIEELFTAITRVVGDGTKDAIKTVMTLPLSSDSNPFVEIVSNPSFVEKTSKDSDRLKEFRSNVDEFVMNRLWTSQAVYFVQSNTKNCQGDDRVPAQVRLCLAEYPGSVFEALFIGREKEGRTAGSEPVYLRGPPGYMLLGKGSYAHTTLEKVLRDSMKYYGLHGSKEADVDKDTLSQQLLKVSGGDKSDMPPTFNIPILRSPHGEAISSISEKDSRNYPMLAGDCAWSHITAACQEELFDFLQRTGLYASDDYKEMMHKHHVHPDKDIDWLHRFETSGKVQVEHPPKKIGTSADHKHKGHEDVEDDGTQKHEDHHHKGKCSKKHWKAHHKGKNEDDPGCKPP